MRSENNKDIRNLSLLLINVLCFISDLGLTNEKLQQCLDKVST